MAIFDSFKKANETVRAAQQEAKEMEEMRREHARIAAEEAAKQRGAKP